jgi:hypothetical protein
MHSPDLQVDPLLTRGMAQAAQVSDKIGYGTIGGLENHVCRPGGRADVRLEHIRAFEQPFR